MKTFKMLALKMNIIKSFWRVVYARISMGGIPISHSINPVDSSPNLLRVKKEELPKEDQISNSTDQTNTSDNRSQSYCH